MFISIVTCSEFFKWMKDNELILGILGSAIVGSMPETLPTFSELPQWIWSWLHDSSKTFLNFKRGVPISEDKSKDTPKPPQLLNG